MPSEVWPFGTLMPSEVWPFGVLTLRGPSLSGTGS